MPTERRYLPRPTATPSEGGYAPGLAKEKRGDSTLGIPLWRAGLFSSKWINTFFKSLSNFIWLLKENNLVTLSKTFKKI